MVHRPLGETCMSSEYPAEYFLSRKLLWKDRPDDSITTAIRFLNPRAPDEILDVGCGLGQIAALIADYGSDVTGIDSSSFAIDTSRSLWGNKRNLTFIQKDVTVEGIEGMYDKILCHHMLEHIERENAAKIVRQIYQALNPSGIFVLGIPINDRIILKRSVFQIARRIGASQFALKIIEPTHLASYSIDQIQRMLIEAGFRIENQFDFSYSGIEFPQPLYSFPVFGKYLISATVISCSKNQR